MSWTLVTGGAKGIGAEICRQLATRGHSIVVHYNKSEKAAENVVTECKHLGAKAEKLQGDFSTHQSLDKFIQNYLHAYPNTNTLINNVGNWLVGSLVETNNKQWNDLFQTNLHAPFTLISALLPSLKVSQGNIINLGAAGLKPLAVNSYSTAFNMTKMDLWTLTRSFAKELVPFNIRVNMVSPGVVENSIDFPEDFKNKVLMQRVATLTEVARMVTFLLEKENNYITGQNIEIAGGFGL